MTAHNLEDPMVVYRRWWAAISSRLGAKTVSDYRYYVLKAWAEMGRDLQSVSKAELEDFLGQLRVQYAQVMRYALNDYLEFLVKHGHRADNPLREVKKVTTRGGRRAKRALTEEELTRLVIAALFGPRPRQADNMTGTRLAWSIITQYALGLRPGELCNLTPENITLNGDSSSVYITHTKTGNDRTVPMNRLAREAIAELLSNQRGNLVGIGTSQYWGHVRRAAKMAQIPEAKCRPYALRHSFATHLRRRGADWSLIAQLMGHSDVRAIMGYLGAEDLELKTAVRLLDEAGN